MKIRYISLFFIALTLLIPIAHAADSTSTFSYTITNNTDSDIKYLYAFYKGGKYRGEPFYDWIKEGQSKQEGGKCCSVMNPRECLVGLIVHKKGDQNDVFFKFPAGFISCKHTSKRMVISQTASGLKAQFTMETDKGETTATILGKKTDSSYF